MPDLKTSQDYNEYIRSRTAAWKAAKQSNAGSARVH
jgi:hypothetical protein